MAREATCPICSANIPVDSDQKVGEFVYCSYCNAQLRITGQNVDDEGELTGQDEIEEDWG